VPIARRRLTDIKDPKDRLANRIEGLLKATQRHLTYEVNERERIEAVYVDPGRKAYALARIDIKINDLRVEVAALSAELDLVVDLVLFPDPDRRTDPRTKLDKVV